MLNAKLVKLKKRVNDKIIKLAEDDSSSESMYTLLKLKAAFENEVYLAKYFFEKLIELGEFIDCNDKDMSINIYELEKYCNRILKLGDYKSSEYHRKAIKKILEENENKMSVINVKTCVLNQDFSLRNNMIMRAMRIVGIKGHRAIIREKNIIIEKKGDACSCRDIALFDFLVGKFLENGCQATQLVCRKDILDVLGLEHNRYNNERIMDSLTTIASQTFMINDDQAEDKVGKKIKANITCQGRSLIKLKGASLFSFIALEENNEIYIKFAIPLIKYFSQSNHLGKYVSKEIMKCWNKDPQVCLIAKELCKLIRMNTANRITTPTISINKLLDNIGMLDEYNNASGRKKSRILIALFESIRIAKSFINTNIQFKITKCTPEFINKGKIQIYNREII